MNALTVLLASLLAAGCLAAGGAAEAPKPLYDFPGASGPGDLAGWTSWSPRAEIAPEFTVTRLPGSDRYGLRISGEGNPAAWGAWKRRVEGVTPGRTYRFSALYLADGVPYERRSISARLEWLDANGKQVRPPDYVLDVPAEKGEKWTRVEHVCAAPEKASSVVIELAFGWCRGGSVTWRDVRLVAEPSPRQRVVRAMTVGHRPRGTKSAAESVAQFCRIVEAAADRKPDIVCLPEGITIVGNGKSFADVSEPVPGPTTKTLGALAKKLRCYVVAGVYERVGPVIYNTAVLIDRNGELAGTYRKTHLPREEVEGGLTPGDSYPVFDTDFGKVGLMICWDVQFPEPARALALKGAELILLPIWGGNEVLARARAIENHVFLVSSSYDMKTFIVDPVGGVLAEASSGEPAPVAELHLDRKIVQPWLGDMKTRTWKERRPDLPVR